MTKNIVDVRTIRFGLKQLQGSIFDLGNADPSRKFVNFYSFDILNIEQFVLQSVKNNAAPFVPYARNGVKEFHASHMAGTYFPKMASLVETVKMLSPLFEYSEYLKVFVGSSQEIGLLNKGVDLNWGNIWPGSSQLTQLNGRQIIAAEIFNMLVNKIRMQAKSQRVQARIYTRNKEANKVYVEYCKYADALFNCYDRLVVFRVDLFYKKEFSATKNTHESIENLNHMIANRRCNSVFKFMRGYIVKLEYGVEKGIHFHTIFFFDVSEHKNASPFHFAQEIGEYWANQITHGQGDYSNSYDKANNSKKLNHREIGEVNCCDAYTRGHLKGKVLLYLCKMDQYIKPKFDSKIRLIRRGNFPKIPSKKLDKPQQERLARRSNKSNSRCPEFSAKAI